MFKLYDGFNTTEVKKKSFRKKAWELFCDFMLLLWFAAGVFAICKLAVDAF